MFTFSPGLCVCVCVCGVQIPTSPRRLACLTQRQAEQVRAQEYLGLYLVGQKVHSDFFLLQQTFGPTLYLLCPLSQIALRCSAYPLEGTVVMAIKADL